MSTLESVSFARGPSNTIPGDRIPGRLLVESDTGTCWVDDDGVTRIQLKDPSKLPLSGGTIVGDLTVTGTVTATTVNAGGTVTGGGGGIAYIKSAGNGRAYTATVAGLAAVTNGTPILLKLHADCADNATLNVNGAGAKPLFMGDAAVTEASLTANNIYQVVFDSTDNRWYVVGSYGGGRSDAIAGGYGVCNTYGLTASKVVDIPNVTLEVGTPITVKFVNAVPKEATLNVSGTGPVPIFYRGKALEDKIIYAGDLITFVYDGSAWCLTSFDRQSELEVSGLAIHQGGTSATTVADAVDNLHVVSLAPEKPITFFDNMDDFTAPGCFVTTTRVSAAPTSAPSNASVGKHLIWVVAPSDIETVQIWLDLKAQRWYERHNDDGTWTPWAIRGAQKVPCFGVHLPVGDWDTVTKQIRVTVPGVLADETRQKIDWRPNHNNLKNCRSIDLTCVGQSDDTLIFEASAVPTVNLSIFVTIQETDYTGLL